LQLEVLPKTVEAVEDTSGVPKIKKRRKKRKQETLGITNTLGMTTETTPIEESLEKSIPKKKRRGPKDSNPNSAHSCVGDNVSKVIFDPCLILAI